MKIPLYIQCFQWRGNHNILTFDEFAADLHKNNIVRFILNL
jgi:hypothetical protein